MQFNFQEALNTGAEQAKQKEINSKIINSTFENFSAEIEKFMNITLNTKVVTEFEKAKPTDSYKSAVEIAAMNINDLFRREERKKSGYFRWLLQNQENEKSVELFSYKEGRAGFPVQLKIDDNTTICDDENEVIEFLADLASDSDFHFKLNKIK